MDDTEQQKNTANTNFFIEYFTRVTPFSKYLALSFFILFPIAGFYLGIFYAEEYPDPSNKIIFDNNVAENKSDDQVDQLEKGSIQDNVAESEAETTDIPAKSIETVDNTKSRPVSIKEAKAIIIDKYGDNTLLQLIFSDEQRSWFNIPRESEGCSNLKYIDLNTSYENESDLYSCPVISVIDSGPYFIEYSMYAYDGYDFRNLYVTNLTTMERKLVHSLKDGETTLKGCYEATYDPICKAEISFSNGYLNINVYEATGPHEQYAVYENTNKIRTDVVNLWEVFERH